MRIDLRTKLEALWIMFTFVLLAYLMVQVGQTERKVLKYIVCPDGQDNCTPYEPHEVKVIYE